MSKKILFTTYTAIFFLGLFTCPILQTGEFKPVDDGDISRVPSDPGISRESSKLTDEEIASLHEHAQETGNIAGWQNPHVDPQHDIIPKPTGKPDEQPQVPREINREEPDSPEEGRVVDVPQRSLIPNDDDESYTLTPEDKQQLQQKITDASYTLKLMQSLTFKKTYLNKYTDPINIMYGNLQDIAFDLNKPSPSENILISLETIFNEYDLMLTEIQEDINGASEEKIITAQTQVLKKTIVAAKSTTNLLLKIFLTTGAITGLFFLLKFLGTYESKHT